ncbi:hypothetical protein OSTOST_19554, partial [Ostertagia ostertagi]
SAPYLAVHNRNRGWKQSDHKWADFQLWYDVHEKNRKVYYALNENSGSGSGVIPLSITVVNTWFKNMLKTGYEFTALCTARGRTACIASVETHRTILECIQSQLPYAIQLFSVEQTRDHLPGVESFVSQVIKATFTKGYTGAIFIKGFYKDHNDIFFLGFGLEPESETLRTLMSISRSLTPWETMVIESHYDTNDSL